MHKTTHGHSSHCATQKSVTYLTDRAQYIKSDTVVQRRAHHDFGPPPTIHRRPWTVSNRRDRALDEVPGLRGLSKSDLWQRLDVVNGKIELAKKQMRAPAQKVKHAFGAVRAMRREGQWPTPTSRARALKNNNYE